MHHSRPSARAADWPQSRLTNKPDPYATPLHKTIDTVLSILCVAILIVLLYAGMHRRAQATTHQARSSTSSQSTAAAEYPRR